MNKSQEKKHLYIVLSKTNTNMGGLIRTFTKSEYNHVSLSLNDSLQPLYSFARYHINAPLVGGFVEESWLRYVYNEKDALIRIYKIEIDSNSYLKINDIIKSLKDKKANIYDTFGVFKNITPGKDCNYKCTCLSFAVDILYRADILKKQDRIRTIRALANKLSPYYYKTEIISFKDKEKYVWLDDRYYEKKKLRSVLAETIIQMKKALLQ